MKKIAAAVLVAAICLAGVPMIAGCSASVMYTLNAEGTGYVVRGSGYISSLKGELEIPAYYGEEGGELLPVTEIADQAFSNASLTKVTIPATVTKIGTAAFAYSYTLEELVFAEGIALTEIPWGVFGYCTSLREIEVPDGVSAIAGMAFYSCSGLRTVGMPDGLKTIGPRAFESCSSLGSVNFPEGLTTIGELAFYSSGLTEVEIPASVCDLVEEGTEAEGESAQKTTYGIGSCAFHTCVGLTRAVIKGNVETIRSGAFGYCTALKEIWLPSSVKKIEGAAYGSDGKIFCGHAFHNDAALTDVYFAGSEVQWGQVEVVTESVSLNGALCDNSALVNAAKHFGEIYIGEPSGE